MTDKKMVLYAVGGLAVLLFFAYKKRPVPKTPEEAKEISEKQGIVRDSTLLANKQFAGMMGPSYIRPKSLIPNVYGRFQNANGGSETLPTDSIYEACKCSGKNAVPPTIISNFR